MRLDPRLANLALLRLAAFRLQHGPPPPPDWEQLEGLSAILDYAKRLPPRDPWDTDGVAETGMGKLLREAKAWVQAEREGQA
jgi:hypothetical protein